MSIKCDCCGKFRKESDVFQNSGESDDCGNYQTWIECRFCCSGINEERYFKKGNKEELK